MPDLPEFDDQAIWALANLISGDNQPWYKTQNELPRYFRRAGLECGDFDPDARSRRAWVSERLRERQADPAQFVQAITRIADPREHRGHPELARQALEILNNILEPDGIKVVWNSGAFRLESTEFAFYPDDEPSEPSYLSLTVTGILHSGEFAGIVQARFDEAASSRSAGAYLCSVIMLGSGLEGLLWGFAEARSSEAQASQKAPKDKRGNVKAIDDWTLYHLIEVAHDCGWIQKDAHAFGQNVRDFRNLVHPLKQWRHGYDPTDQGTCRVCWEVASVVIEDLKNQINRDSNDPTAPA